MDGVRSTPSFSTITKPDSVSAPSQIQKSATATVQTEVRKATATVTAPVKSAIESLSPVKDIMGKMPDLQRLSKLSPLETGVTTKSSTKTGTLQSGVKVGDDSVKAHAEVVAGSTKGKAKFDNGLTVSARASGKLLSANASADFEHGIKASVAVAKASASTTAEIAGHKVTAVAKAEALSAKAGISGDLIGASATLGKVSTGVKMGSCGTLGVGLSAGVGCEISHNTLTVSLGVEIAIPIGVFNPKNWFS